MSDFIRRYDTFLWSKALQICLTQHYQAVALDVPSLEQRNYPEVQSADDTGGSRTQEDHENFDIAIRKGLESYKAHKVQTSRLASR
jgi:hypothetical protein